MTGIDSHVRAGAFFGRLEAIEPITGAGADIEIWHCRCTCGAVSYELSTCLQDGDKVSCGDCGPRPTWSPAEDDLLRREYSHTPNAVLAARLDRSKLAIRHRGGTLGIKKSPEFMASPAGGRIQPGNVPPNKGRKGMPMHPNSQRTQFKAGNRPHTWRPIGHERVSRDGYLQRKVTETGYTPRDYRNVHHLVWEAAGREIPPNHALCFLNADKSDLRLENLELLHRAELMRRNSRQHLPPELNDIVSQRAALTRRIRNKERQLNEKSNG